MNLPTRISPAARGRRALLVDLLAGALLALVALQLAAGLGVVGFFGLPLLALCLCGSGVERLLRRFSSRRWRVG